MLSIVTICYQDLNAVNRTIDSVKGQSVFALIGVRFEHIIVIAGISEIQCEHLRRRYENNGVQIICNSDNGLYNAMNIGIGKATGDHIYFLNGGDEFYDELSLQNILGAKSNGKISMFRVAQEYSDWKYIRPGINKCGALRSSYSHQGFVAPLDSKTPVYDENLKINADSDWMDKCKDIYEHSCHNIIIANFDLGGISNNPSLKTVWIRLESNGALRGVIEFLKLIASKILGLKMYYLILSVAKGYDVKRVDEVND